MRKLELDMATFLLSSCSSIAVLFRFASSAEFLLLSLLGLVAAVSVLLKPRLRLPPGPFAFPVIGNWPQVGGNINHEILSLLAKRYGEILFLRMGHRNLVVVSSPQIAKEVLLTKGVEFGSRPRNIVVDIFTCEGQDLVYAMYGDHWRKLRRIATVSFLTNKAIQHSRALLQQELDYAIADLKAKPGAATTGVVVRHRLQLLLYNYIYLILFNRRFDGEDDPIFLELRRLNAMKGKLAQSLEYNYGDFIPILRPFLRKYLKRCENLRDERFRFLKKHFVDNYKNVLRVKPSSGNATCALDHLLNAQSKGEITEEDLLFLMESINSAAFDTSLWSIEWAMAELANNPDIQRKVRAELNTVLGKGMAITELDVSRLPYLQAVLKETLRLHMTVPLLVPHMNLHQEKLGGYDIPAGSKIVVNAWHLANNPEFWEKPELFNPDRFLGAEIIDANGNDFRFLPFGNGRRSCPGIILAIPMVSLVLGSLVREFELLPLPGQSKVDMTGESGQFIWRLANYSVIVCKPIA